MIRSKYGNPLENFIVHGSKTISGDSHTYILLVDETGQALIEKFSSDSSTILFTEMVNPNSSQNNVIAEAITTFWNGDISAYSYVYLFQLSS